MSLDKKRCCAYQEVYSSFLPVGPLAEMDFWQARHEVLGGLYEPLDMPQARSIVLLLKNQSTDRNLLAFFHTQYSELVKVRDVQLSRLMSLLYDTLYIFHNAI